MLKTPPAKPQPKKLFWMGSSKDDLSEMPQDVKDTMGHALYIAQLGDKAAGDVKPLASLGSGVMQVSEDDDGNTYRAVYTVHFEDAVYVLHCFQKKSKEGIKTPKEDLKVIQDRLKRVNEIEQEKAKAQKKASKAAPKSK